MHSLTAPDVASAFVVSASSSSVVLSLPDSNYQVTLACNAPPSSRGSNHRVSGVIHLTALKLNRAHGGGSFIEPCIGEPRILQGRVLATDLRSNQLLAHAVVPMWVKLPLGQSAADFSTGELVNFYAQSGASFSPTQG